MPSVTIDASPLRDRMIFVVGARRSGTNWLGRIIESHPDVAVVKSESHLFSNGIGPLMERFQHASMGSWQLGTIYMERAELLDALRAFCDAVFSSVLASDGTGATRLAERTPHHSRWLELIGAVYPDAHVVHIIRDGRDVVRSLLQMSWGPDTVEEAAAEWKESVEAARRAGPSLARYHEVRYEELLSDTRAEVIRLFDRLDLTRSDPILERALVESIVPFNVDRSKPELSAGKWQGSLSAADLRAMETVAGSLLRDLRYQQGLPAPAPAPAPVPAPGPTVARSDRVRRASAGVRRAVGQVAGRRRRGRGAVDSLVLQDVVDRFLSAVRDGRRGDAAALLKDQVRVRVISAESEWEDRGAPAKVRLLDVLADDVAFTSRQRRCDVWPSPHLFTIVLESDGDDRVRRRVLVVYVGPAGISRVVHYILD